MSKMDESGIPMTGHRLVVAGGGTGGHLFPGIAVAQAFAARHAENRVLFINAGRPLEIQVLSRLGWDQKAIAIEGIKGRGRWSQLVAGLKIPGAIRHSRQLLKSFRADMVLGVGGYSAGPVVTAAWLLGLPTALHEQNQLPGVTNRMLGRLVDRIYLSFEGSRQHFNSAKVKVTGNPVRDEIIALGSGERSPGDDATFTVLIIGGSQGAQAINQAMLDAVPRLKKLAGLRLVHQTGSDDETMVRQAYERIGVQARVQAFFNDMARQYREADLIVCRAGATTVAEIALVGIAAVFIPFPFATDDHQTRNAQALVDAGAAEMIAQVDLGGQTLADTMATYMQDRGRLAQMAANARSLCRPEAARVIVDDMYELMKGVEPSNLKK